MNLHVANVIAVYFHQRTLWSMIGKNIFLLILSDVFLIVSIGDKIIYENFSCSEELSPTGEFIPRYTYCWDEVRYCKVYSYHSLHSIISGNVQAFFCFSIFCWHTVTAFFNDQKSWSVFNFPVVATFKVVGLGAV